MAISNLYHRPSCVALLVLAFVLLISSGVSEDAPQITVVPATYILSGDESMPSTVSLNITLEGKDLRLKMSKSPDVQADIPVYQLTTNDLGTFDSKRAQLDKAKEFAIYADVENKAAVKISSETDDSGLSYLKLEGVVHSENKMFNLESKVDLHKQRVQRDVDSTYSEEFHLKEDFLVHELVEASADQLDSVKIELKSPEKVEIAGIPPPPQILSRRKRQVTQDVNVDVVALVDYGVYSRWYSRSTATTVVAKQTDTLTKLQQYYAFIFNGVNMLYKSITSLPYKINVRLSSIVISTTALASPWSEKFRKTSVPWDSVDGYLVLGALDTWAATADTLPKYDHLMLFTGYDMTMLQGTVVSKGLAGLAYVGTLCDTTGKATSVTEDLGGFQCMKTAAHELGHGLSSPHDGVGNLCLGSDNFIMQSGYYAQTELNKLNPWRFSSCSPTYFNSFFRTQVATDKGRQCLYQVATSSNPPPNVDSLMPGQIYSPDEQCRQVYGPGSFLCQAISNWNPSKVCTDMYCYDPSSTGLCYKLVAARGTTCGSRKWCVDGQCVSNSSAPAVDDSCPFGEQPGPAFTNVNKTCPVLISSFPGYCYYSDYKTRCCQSCANAYSPISGCSYGDSATGCDSRYCLPIYPSYVAQCCGTCKVGQTTTTQTTTTTRTTTPTTTTRTTTPTTTTRTTTPTTTTRTTTPTTTTRTTTPTTTTRPTSTTTTTRPTSTTTTTRTTTPTTTTRTTTPTTTTRPTSTTTTTRPTSTTTTTRPTSTTRKV